MIILLLEHRHENTYACYRILDGHVSSSSAGKAAVRCKQYARIGGSLFGRCIQLRRDEKSYVDSFHVHSSRIHGAAAHEKGKQCLSIMASRFHTSSLSLTSYFIAMKMVNFCKETNYYEGKMCLACQLFLLHANTKNPFIAIFRTQEQQCVSSLF